VTVEAVALESLTPIKQPTHKQKSKPARSHLVFMYLKVRADFLQQRYFACCSRSSAEHERILAVEEKLLSSLAHVVASF
jgi:hypothetical protein